MLRNRLATYSTYVRCVCACVAKVIVDCGTLSGGEEVFGEAPYTTSSFLYKKVQQS